MDQLHQDHFVFILLLSIVVLFFFTWATQKKEPKPEPKKPEPIVVKITMSVAINIAITLTIGITIAFMLGLRPKNELINTVKNILQPRSSAPVYYYYHTDPKYDAYIKGNLLQRELAQFDKILDFEHQQGGKVLYDRDLKYLSDGNQTLQQAYRRWCRCKNLRRASSQVVYPGER